MSRIALERSTWMLTGQRRTQLAALVRPGGDEAVSEGEQSAPPRPPGPRVWRADQSRRSPPKEAGVVRCGATKVATSHMRSDEP